MCPHAPPSGGILPQYPPSGGYPQTHKRQDEPGFSLDNTSSGRYRLVCWLVFIAVIEHRDGLGRQLLPAASARAFSQHVQASNPRLLLPEQGARYHRGDLVLEHAPDPPPREHPFLIESSPAVAELAPHAPLQQHRIE